MKKIAILITDDISVFHLSVPLAIFADIIPDHSLFNVVLCSVQGKTIKTSHGMHITPEYDLSVLRTADMVIVPFWPSPDIVPEPQLTEALREAAQHNATIVGLCLGAYALAYSGLLDARNASTHWLYESDFQSRFPNTHLDMNALYVADDNIITSAGTAAGMDCCLYLVRELYGSNIANQIARRMVIPPHRDGGQAQYIQMPFPSATKDRQIILLVETLRQDLARRWTLDELCEVVSMSRRTFTRRFRQSTGMTLVDWLTTERLREAQVLLESTAHSVQKVSELVGFSSATSLREKFVRKFGVSPSVWRKTFRGSEAI
ncbi:helix-turn-helix domain-containing protein [Salmonella enterica]|jgi:transcriptional regulator GlxA family with amidase domain